MGDQVRHQALVARLVFADGHQTFTDFGAGQQLGFDFAQLDAEAADLDLRVVATDIDHPTVGAVAGDIAGAVQPGIGACRERVGNETLGVQFVAIEVMSGHAGAADVDLAIDPHRHRLSVVVENPQAQVGQGRADQAWRARVDFLLADRVVGGVHGDFGDAVHVHQARAGQRRTRGPWPQAAEVQGFAAEDHFPQAVLQVAALTGFDELAEGARRLVQHGHLLLADQCVEVVGRTGHFARHHHQLAAVAQRAPDFPDREVEGKGMEQRPDVLVTEVEQLGGGIEQTRHVAVLDQYALGQTGGTRGVDDIGQVPRRQAKRLGVRVAVQVRQVVGGEVRVEAHHRHGVLGQCAEARRLRQQHDRGAVVQQVAEPFGGVGRVQRHIGRTGLEHRQYRADHFHAALGQDRDPVVRAHSLVQQQPGDAVGPAIEGLVTQLRFAKDQGDAVGLGGGELFEALMNQRLGAEHRLGRQRGRRGLALCGAEQRQAEHRLLDIRHHRFEQGLEMLGETLNGGAVEQVAGVFDHASQRAAVITQGQHQVELRGFMGLGHRHQGQAGQAQLATARGVVQRQGDLAQRVVAQGARRLYGFDDLLERNVLVLVGRQGGLFDLLQQLRHARVLRQVYAQGQGVDEETDQVFGLGAAAVGRRYADDHVPFVAQARHEHRPGAEQRHEQGHVVCLAELLQAFAQGRGDGHCDVAAPIALHRRTWAVGGQGQQGRRAFQVLTPEPGLAIEAFAVEGLVLPGGVVGILDRQRRQGIGLLLVEGPVEGGEFLDQHTHRPAVGDDVVLGDQQDVFVIGQAQQASTNQRPTAQVERRQGLVVTDA